ncbi:hypothetical protein [Cellulosilyticum lentocellum]|uniref:Uncharacterized protein n=1 Tax=Cellulosilyticum lentocellum (strain ATCC 49066 / DSM 5427 / NCIMB 11756 / RHM5) TaxID=642492 RepID=F2JQG2_CELLD|nr:hypothetical protein [Cellulosilyticum lentocellum]ADZ84946.1 hypothetical protein Clole_3253 [Cellulosilyticum lentocellum DSM 5427]
MSEKHKKITVMLGLLLIVCMLFSIVYINKENHHDCTGQGCPICLQIHVARDLLNSIKGAVLGALLIQPLCLIRVHIQAGVAVNLSQSSPITLKVKLLN